MTGSFATEKSRSPSRLNLIWVSERSWPERRIGRCRMSKVMHEQGGQRRERRGCVLAVCVKCYVPLLQVCGGRRWWIEDGLRPPTANRHHQTRSCQASCPSQMSKRILHGSAAQQASETQHRTARHGTALPWPAPRRGCRQSQKCETAEPKRISSRCSKTLRVRLQSPVKICIRCPRPAQLATV
jgi:hypothetical protein